MNTILKFKCLKCSLHFTLYTDDKKRWLNSKPHCPECGQNKEFLMWGEDTDKQIFELVPGNTPLLGLLSKSDK